MSFHVIWALTPYSVVPFPHWHHDLLKTSLLHGMGILSMANSGPNTNPASPPSTSPTPSRGLGFRTTSPKSAENHPLRMTATDLTTPHPAADKPKMDPQPGSPREPVFFLLPEVITTKKNND